MKNKKIAIFGCKNTTKFLIESLAETIKINYLITIDPAKGEKFKVADYSDLNICAKKYGIEVYNSKTYNLKNEEDVQNISKLNIDIAFVIGWQRIIPETVLKTLSIGAFGMHGSSMDLPLGRGRSPLNWSIIENRSFFYTNLFKYDPGIDSGDILDVNKFSITSADTSETLHFKNTLSMKFLIEKNLKSLLENNFSLKRQKDIKPTYYPKREPSDSLINWKLEISEIERFIRAVTKPFNGAFSYINKHKIIIFSARIFSTNNYYGFKNKKIGEIVAVFPNNKFLIRCNGGLLLVDDYKIDNFNLEINQFLNNSSDKIKIFKKNKDGFYDL